MNKLEEIRKALDFASHKRVRVGEWYCNVEDITKITTHEQYMPLAQEVNL